jgi:cyclophilin family peptidyl-prolyl cis-trans isomerase
LTPVRTPWRSQNAILALIVASIAFAAAACNVGVQGAVSPLPTVDVSGCPLGQPAALPAGETRTVDIKTSKGSITIKVEGSLSPIAAGNFVALVACGFYDGVVFHRAAALEDGTPFVIQGGDPSLTGGSRLPYRIQDEPVTATYQRGTVAMARTEAPNSQTSQFFIVLSDAAGPILASYNTYAIFGEVSAGMETADAIFAAADAELPSQPIAMEDVSVSTP